jgi:hypothetical protein
MIVAADSPRLIASLERITMIVAAGSPWWIASLERIA